MGDGLNIDQCNLSPYSLPIYTNRLLQLPPKVFQTDYDNIKLMQSRYYFIQSCHLRKN